ncbi:TonB-dependent receptor [Hugenholtzia roseola]|uniref:TonB-dependent receptor n=1 Tax=Hugenholtzia roseola TaxID=1002 RepID=UPI00040E1814|nr:TonB-dependent receptor [Hugenholtzia roseola]
MKNITLYYFLFIFSFFCTTFSAYAQNYSIFGKAQSDTGEAISFAAVGLMQTADSSLVKAVAADENGDFRLIGIAKGRYFIVLTSVGYAPFRSTDFLLENQDLRLETFVLKGENILQEVEVKASKPLVEVLADKTVFNINGTIAAAGTSGLEVLRKAPGVMLDNNSNLIVEGKTGVQVYIDGKPSPLQGDALTNYLNTLQAADIEAIEIITQPSSKYDAAGSAGILNIKLKKDKNLGTNGTVGLGYSVWDNQRGNASLSINNRTRKRNSYLNYSNRVGETGHFTNLYRLQSNFIFDAQSTAIDRENSHNLRLGTDVFASKRSTFGVLLNANFSDRGFDNQAETPILVQNTKEILQILKADNTDDRRFSNLLGNLNYRYEDTTGRSFNVDFDLGRYDSDRTNYQPNFYYDATGTTLISQSIFEMITPTRIDLLSFKADYEQNFLKGKLGVGIKTSSVKTDNTFDFYDVNEQGTKVLNQDKSNRFFYDEQIHAAYLNYNRRWKKVNLQMGLRVENTVSDGKLNSNQTQNNARVRRNYTNLFPSGGLTYQANPHNSFALTYSRRIERPNYQHLNPFEMQLDELTLRKGNAFLQPQYTDNFKISHTYKYALTTAISYSFVNDFFAQVTQALDERRGFIQTQNIATQQTWSLNISYPFEVVKGWEAFLNVNAYHAAYKGKTEAFVAIEQTTLNVYGQNTFSLPKNFKIEVSGWYNSPSIWGGTYRTKSLGSLDLAVQKSFLENKLSARLALSDVFFTSPWRGDTEFDNVIIRGNGGWESRQLRFNLTYNFGNAQVKSAARRKIGAEDETNRIEK